MDKSRAEYEKNPYRYFVFDDHSQMVRTLERDLNTSLGKHYKPPTPTKPPVDSSLSTFCILNHGKLTTIIEGGSRVILSHNLHAFDITRFRSKKIGKTESGGKIVERDICKEDDFLIIGNKELWRKMSPTQVVNYIYILRSINPKMNVRHIARSIVYNSVRYRKHAKRNVSVIVAEFFHEEPLRSRKK